MGQRTKYLAIGLLAAIGMCASNAVVSAADVVNPAKGRPCTFNIQPSYNKKNSKPADLTDGVIPRQQGTRAGWVYPGMVGWANFRRHARTIQITVDLGQMRPIGGVSLTSAGGGGIATHPSSILIQTSDDGKQFLTAGDLVKLDENAPIPVYGDASFHTFQTHQLRTKGRYVRFLCVIPTKLFSCGEVQVFEGESELLNQPASGQIISEADAIDPLRLTQLGVRRRLLQDVQMVRQAVGPHSPAMADLDQLEREAKQQTYPEKLDGFVATWPVNDLDRKIFAIRGERLAVRGYASMTLWRTPPYELLDLLALPPKAGTSAEPSMAANMMNNEHRAQAFNLTNASRQPVKVKFQLSNLPGGVNPDYVSVFAVQWLDTREGRPRDLELKPLQARSGWYETTVPAGFSRQIWLSFHPEEIDPGTYHGWLHVVSGAWKGGMDLNLSIAPIRFPDRVDFTLGAWDYIFAKTRSITDANQADMKALFAGHLGNMPWLGWMRIKDVAKFDADGNLTGSVDYSQWDAFVKYWPHARHYGVYLSVHDTLALGSPQLAHLVTAFAADWAKHNQSLGIKAGQVVVSFGDEPRTSDEFLRQAQRSAALRKGTRDILIHINPTPYDLDAVVHAREAVELADIIMPPHTRVEAGRNKKDGKMLREFADQGKRIWSYLMDGGKQKPPAYFRIQPWSLFALYGISGNGEGFWALSDATAKNNWNDYTAVGLVDYSPVYVAADHAATSKLWEAAREGVEDWQYLKMLSDAGQVKQAREIAGLFHQAALKTYGVTYGMTPQSGRVSELAEQGRLAALKRLSRVPRP